MHEKLYLRYSTMQIVRKSGLVLEGGGMRGVFTSGVLDAFMKHEVYFSYVVAVSAGACNGLSYISRQPRRARISNIDMLVEYDYISLRHLVSQGSIFDPDLLYRRFPDELVPYDYDAYFANPATFEMVATNCLTGRPEYLTERSGDRARLIDIVKASSSLPYVCKTVNVDGTPMLDGGIVDSIPVRRAMERGHANNVVVLTRPSGFRLSEKKNKLPPLAYRRYPRLRTALSRRNKVYNDQLEMVDELELAGTITCIRPTGRINVDRMERNPAKLIPLYDEGYALGEMFCKEHYQS